MSLDRVFLALGSLAFAGLGLAYLVAPAEMMLLTEMTLPTATAQIEVRGFYGGQMLGIALFAWLGLRREALRVPALLLIAADLGGTALGRAVGMAVAGSAPPVMVGLFALEAGTTLLALWFATRPVPRPA